MLWPVDALVARDDINNVNLARGQRRHAILRYCGPWRWAVLPFPLPFLLYLCVVARKAMLAWWNCWRRRECTEYMCVCHCDLPQQKRTPVTPCQQAKILHEASPGVLILKCEASSWIFGLRWVRPFQQGRQRALLQSASFNVCNFSPKH